MWAFLRDQMNRGASKREREKNGGKEGEPSHPTPPPRSFFLFTLFCAVPVRLEQASQELDLLHHHTHYKKEI